MFKDFDSIQVGETQTLSKLITEVDVRKFVDMTGDNNPLHVQGYRSAWDARRFVYFYSNRY